MISENLTSLHGKPVKDYNVKTGIQSPETIVYRLRVDYDSFSAGQNIPDLLNQFCKDPQASSVDALIIGAFDFEGGDSSEIINTLAGLSAKLPALKVLFVGDITYEENEISWINQCDVSPVLKAYPDLEYFRVRGGNDLSFGKEPFAHGKLKTLIVESGGLPPTVITQIGRANLPNLEHLELWLGSDNYGFNSTVEDFRPVLNATNFPKLRYLGLRDSEIADDLAKAFDHAPVLNQLQTLDLSMGTLGDDGARALLGNPAIKKLKTLDLHYHFISDALVSQLKQLGITVNLDEKQEADGEYRYIAVSE